MQYFDTQFVLLYLQMDDAVEMEVSSGEEDGDESDDEEEKTIKERRPADQAPSASQVSYCRTCIFFGIHVVEDIYIHL